MSLSLRPRDFRNIHEVRQERNRAIQKGLYGDIEKAEGSKGGKVIGHTKSGKAIYQRTASHESHKNFTADEHYDAASLLSKESEKESDEEEKRDIKTKANSHRIEADKKLKEERSK